MKTSLSIVKEVLNNHSVAKVAACALRVHYLVALKSGSTDSEAIKLKQMCVQRVQTLVKLWIEKEAVIGGTGFGGKYSNLAKEVEVTTVE